MEIQERQRENLRVFTLVEPWIPRIQVKCSGIGIVVDRKIHLMWAVLPLLTVHMMIECSPHSTFLSQQISTRHQPPANKQYFSPTTNQHQPQLASSFFTWIPFPLLLDCSYEWMDALNSF